MTNKHTHYDIKIQGQLNNGQKEWFDELDITSTTDGNTLLKGMLIDQSALHGVLKKISNLRLTLISVSSHSNPKKENQIETTK